MWWTHGCRLAVMSAGELSQEEAQEGMGAGLGSKRGRPSGRAGIDVQQAEGGGSDGPKQTYVRGGLGGASSQEGLNTRLRESIIGFQQSCERWDRCRADRWRLASIRGE